MASVAQPWLISKFIDPIFAVCVGLSAAAVRIRREEREKYPDQDSSFPALWQKGVTMARSYYAREVKSDSK
ncbi:hypothetical protein HRR83_008994 [Exophiala dermatitidis]|uniref:Uncharacterized protein n=2 Tax=Exophiala dermatitidis TaxID=5970 RepID=H6CBZ9_EXODN|nr:uncharacterized protein HMPREF1120_09230 [Exophiala dermatitidis NIH/UT8656]KAJ4502627.1 hypothetical protein HRR75_008355 [Exophiala dermatitidis]EHY61296.1 hypothetical protein HMPREF1120_09230 [Exophiala dermatitidis NIH/UT8656]KAJ4503469.1 hypothetical protein HRR73_009094 [Exophiala dermatitidis]KAJ4504071.1 hypothetical protein HRR74_009092 [Exophiala dermatitidis]KAJ4528940.1 hypothetical protein HRR76_009555 [Exophiala dermatitidis]